MSANSHFFFDVRLEAFDPDANDDDHGPMAVLNFQTEITAYRHTLIGGKDGYIRRYDAGVDDDDGVAITSYVTLPPVRLGSDEYHDGLLYELIATIPEGSGDVDYEVRVARSHEEVAKASAFFSGTWDGEGLQRTARPRARGASASVRLSNGEGRRWAIEQLVGVVRPVGKTRVS